MLGFRRARAWRVLGVWGLGFLGFGFGGFQVPELHFRNLRACTARCLYTSYEHHADVYGRAQGKMRVGSKSDLVRE